MRRKNQGEHGRPARVDTDPVSNGGSFFPSRPARSREGAPEGAGLVPWTFGRLETPPLQKSKRVQFSVSDRDVEPVEIHDLGPCGHKILYKFCFGVSGSIDFRQGSQLRV